MCLSLESVHTSNHHLSKGEFGRREDVYEGADDKTHACKDEDQGDDEEVDLVVVSTSM